MDLKTLKTSESFIIWNKEKSIENNESGLLKTTLIINIHSFFNYSFENLIINNFFSRIQSYISRSDVIFLIIIEKSDTSDIFKIIDQKQFLFWFYRNFLKKNTVEDGFRDETIKFIQELDIYFLFKSSDT